MNQAMPQRPPAIRPAPASRFPAGGRALLTAAGCLVTSLPLVAADHGFAVSWHTNAAATPGAHHRVVAEARGIPRPVLRSIETGPNPDRVWTELLSVKVDSPDLLSATTLPPMSGTWHVAGDVLRFEPAFPLEPGITYRALFRPRKLPASDPAAPPLVSATWRTEKPRVAPSTQVAAILPSASVLPENLLKFYLQFSAPMGRGQAYQHIRLLDDASGRGVELPFLELTEELWSPDMTRLTLFIDPGRIKRGLKPLEEVGPALEAGRHYTLVVDAAWPDAAGNPLTTDYRKAFTVGAPDRGTPDPARWTVSAPVHGTRQALVVQFDEPLDHALAQRCIRVEQAGGREIPGASHLEDREQRWIFVPQHDWKTGSHRLRIQTRIEDLAGNNIGKPYDVKLADGTMNQRQQEYALRPFEVN